MLGHRAQVVFWQCRLPAYFHWLLISIQLPALMLAAGLAHMRPNTSLINRGTLVEKRMKYALFVSQPIFTRVRPAHLSAGACDDFLLIHSPPQTTYALLSCEATVLSRMVLTISLPTRTASGKRGAKYP